MRGPGEDDSLTRLFGGPTEDERARIRADLIARAVQVQVGGWALYRAVWSTGELIGVAVILADDRELAVLGESRQSGRERWAFDLWGLDSGEADVDNGCKTTCHCFRDAAVALSDALRSSRKHDAQTAGGEA